MFPASFNAKTSIVRWIARFLYAGKETACGRWNVVRVTKKWIRKPSSIFALNFDGSYGALPLQSRPCPLRLLVVPCPKGSLKPGTHMRTKWFVNHSQTVKWFVNHSQTVRKPNAHMCGWDCEPALHRLQTVRIPFAKNWNLSGFFVRTKGIGVPGDLCSPQVCRKLIYHAPSVNCLVRMWFAGVYQPLRRWQFRSDQELLTATQTFFNHLPGSQFCKTFGGNRLKRMQKCILSGGCYFERSKEKWRC